MVLGHNITGPDCVVLARAGGRYVDAQVLPTDEEMAAAAAVAGLEVVRVRLADPVPAGLLQLEVQRGAPPPASTLIYDVIYLSIIYDVITTPSMHPLSHHLTSAPPVPIESQSCVHGSRGHRLRG